MKHHGNYETASIDDIRFALLNGATDYLNAEVQRLKSKHRNSKRHSDKRKKYRYGKVRTEKSRKDKGIFRR